MSLLKLDKFSIEWRRPNLASTMALVLTFLFCLDRVQCEDECLKSRVHCYECESNRDPSCNDPFNNTLQAGNLLLCHGCCVKVVRDRNTPKQNIWRTCTSRLEINLFMVDHVCMGESGGQGHMCFCETDGCNHAEHSVRPHRALVGTAIVVASLFGLSHWTAVWLVATNRWLHSSWSTLPCFHCPK